MTIQAKPITICDKNGRNNIRFADALTLAKAYAPRMPQEEQISLTNSAGRILSKPLFAGHSVPPFANAAMDGYALSKHDLAQAADGLPMGAPILAGIVPQELLSGTTCAITTGAPMPLGANLVIEQERCGVRNGCMFLKTAPSDKPHIRPVGEDIEMGSQLAPAGTRMTSRLAALASATGLDQIGVRAPLRIALISTGDELVGSGEPLAPGKIHDSVRMFLSMELQGCNVQLIDFGVQPDRSQPVADKLRDAVACSDMVLTTGGASVGRADPIRAALNETGASEIFHGVKMRPGKPLGLDCHDGVPIVTLPGNPFAAIVGFNFIVSAMIETALGATIFSARTTTAKLSAEFVRRREVLEFVPVKLGPSGKDAIPLATIIARGSSARLTPLVAADGLAAIDVHGTILPAGTMVAVSEFGAIAK